VPAQKKVFFPAWYKVHPFVRSATFYLLFECKTY
jgi:hypothetical protein